MSIFLLRSFYFILGIISLVDLTPALAENYNIGEINELLKKEKIELDKLKIEIKKQTSALTKMDKSEHSSLKKQRILDDQLKIKERELKIYDWNLKINRNKIKSLTTNIGQNKKHLYLQQKSMARRLRTIYKEGNMFPVKLLFSSDDFIDLLRRMKYLESVSAYDSAMFNKYNEQLNQFNSRKEALLHAKGKLLLFKDAAEIKKREVSAEKLKKTQFLARLGKEKLLNKRLKDELVQSSKKLNQLIARLEEKIIHGEGLDINDKKGRLLPPVKGQFLNKFGRKREKQYNTYIVYNGVNIRSQKGTPVRAISDGKVLYTGTIEGYGNIIIIGHGNDYHSLYGHLDEIITQVGKAVRPGQIIGRSGDTGSTLGESLYFEIRHKGRPVEPTAWLSQSKR